MTKIAAIAFMILVDLIIWWVIRTYDRRGVILSLPWNTYRDRSPRAFRVQLGMLRMSLALCIAFTVIVTAMLLFGTENA